MMLFGPKNSSERYLLERVSCCLHHLRSCLKRTIQPNLSGLHSKFVKLGHFYQETTSSNRDPSPQRGCAPYTTSTFSHLSFSPSFCSWTLQTLPLNNQFNFIYLLIVRTFNIDLNTSYNIIYGHYRFWLSFFPLNII